MNENSSNHPLEVIDETIDAVVRDMTTGAAPVELRARVLESLADSSPAPYSPRSFYAPYVLSGLATAAAIVLAFWLGRSTTPVPADLTMAACPPAPRGAISATTPSAERAAPPTPSPAESSARHAVPVTTRVASAPGEAETAIESSLDLLPVPSPIAVAPLALAEISPAATEISMLNIDPLQLEPLSTLESSWSNQEPGT